MVGCYEPEQKVNNHIYFSAWHLNPYFFMLFLQCLRLVFQVRMWNKLWKWIHFPSSSMELVLSWLAQKWLWLEFNKYLMWKPCKYLKIKNRSKVVQFFFSYETHLCSTMVLHYHAVFSHIYLYQIIAINDFLWLLFPLK